MAWKFLLDERLGEFNQRRVQHGRQALRWPDVSFMIGVSRQLLQNLASNRQVKVTNTRLLDALCRFFNCKLTEIMVPEPEPVGCLADDEVDRLLALKERLKLDGVAEREYVIEPGDRPSCHIDALYS